MTDHVREFRWAYVVFLLLVVIDLLMVARAVHQLGQPDFQIPLDAPLFVLILIALQVLLAWLFLRLRETLEHYRHLKEHYEQELTFAHQILDSSQEGMLVLDGEGRISYANAHIGRFLGIEVQQLLGHFSADFLPKEAYGTLREHEGSRLVGTPVQFLLPVRDAAGSLHQVSVVRSPRWYHGRVVGTFVAVSLPR